MDMTGEYRIPAPRERVWAALNDPSTLKQAIPGCEELKRVSDNELEALVRAKVGPVSAKFSGKVTLEDLNPPESYRIVGEGKGGAAGFAKGGAVVTLVPEGGSTLLRYTANADVGGKLAQIGSRLIQGTAKKMADDFFSRFAAIVGSGEEIGAEPAPSASAAAAPPVAVSPALGGAAMAAAGNGSGAAAANVAQTGGTTTGGAMAAGPGDASSQIARDPIGAEFPGTVGAPRPAGDPDTGAVPYGNASVDQAAQGVGDTTSDPLARQTADPRAQAAVGRDGAIPGGAAAGAAPGAAPTTVGGVAGRAASLPPELAQAPPASPDVTQSPMLAEGAWWQNRWLWVAAAVIAVGALFAIAS